jgi:hypothetical protein
VNVENKPKAEKICSKILKDPVFEECHLFVDPEPFYEDCLYDMCACASDASQCACPILAAYATECARQGTILNWRYQVAECGEISLQLFFTLSPFSLFEMQML